MLGRKVMTFFFLFVVVNSTEEEECFDYAKYDADDYLFMVECYDTFACDHDKIEIFGEFLGPACDEFFSLITETVKEFYEYDFKCPVIWEDHQERMCEKPRELRVQLFKNFALSFELFHGEYDCYDTCVQPVCKRLSSTMNKIFNYVNILIEEGICPAWDKNPSSVKEIKDITG